MIFGISLALINMVRNNTQIFVLILMINLYIQKTHNNVFRERLSIKKGSAKKPDIYLGTEFKKKIDSNGNAILITAYNTCFKEGIITNNSLLSKHEMKINGSTKHPFSDESYRPELDMSLFYKSE